MVSKKKKATARRERRYRRFINRDAPLFKLPAEIRNQIYELTLIDPDPIRIPVEIKNVPKGFSATPCLLQVCKQIRREAINIYFASNVFTLILYNEPLPEGVAKLYCPPSAAVYRKNYSPPFMFDWLEAIGKQSCAAITRLRIEGESDVALHVDFLDVGEYEDEDPIDTSLARRLARQLFLKGVRESAIEFEHLPNEDIDKKVAEYEEMGYIAYPMEEKRWLRKVRWYMRREVRWYMMGLGCAVRN